MPIQKLAPQPWRPRAQLKPGSWAQRSSSLPFYHRDPVLVPLVFVSPKITPKSHFFIHLLVGGFNLCFMVLIYYCSIVLERHREMGKKPQNLRKKGQRSKGYGRQMATLIDMVSLYDKFKSFRRSVI